MYAYVYTCNYLYVFTHTLVFIHKHTYIYLHTYIYILILKNKIAYRETLAMQIWHQTDFRECLSVSSDLIYESRIYIWYKYTFIQVDASSVTGVDGRGEGSTCTFASSYINLFDIHLQDFF